MHQMRLSTRRDVDAAKAFFREAIKSPGPTPTTITLDGHAASRRVEHEMKAQVQFGSDTKLPSSKYLNHSMEADHQGRSVASARRRPLIDCSIRKHALTD